MGIATDILSVAVFNLQALVTLMIDRMFMDMKMGPISVPKCFLVSIVTWQSKGRTNVCRNLYIDCPDICENYHVALAINSSLKIASCGSFSFLS